MRIFISIFIIFTLAVQPVLPLVNYAVNYDYIVKNLCENRNIPQSICNGKCYIQKELAKTEKQSNNNQTVKISGLDVFLPNDILGFLEKEQSAASVKALYSGCKDFYTSEYFYSIFHPPLSRII